MTSCTSSCLSPSSKPHWWRLFVPGPGGGYCPDPVMRASPLPPLTPARRLCVAAALGIGLWAVPTLAQTEAPVPSPLQPQPVPQELEPYEGRLVRVITFRTPDRPATP